MKKIILLIVLHVCSKSNAQVDSSTLAQIKKVSEIETVSSNCQNLICSLSYSQSDSIRKILNIWESIHETNEPIVRLKILLDIQSTTFEDFNYTTYYDTYVNQYKSRWTQYPLEEYEYHKSYFEFVPINGDFDKYTQKLAENLLPLQKIKSSEYLICLLLSNQIEEYEQELKTKSKKNNFIQGYYYSKKLEERFNNPHLELGIANFYPLANFSTYHKPSVGLDVSFSINSFNKYIFGAGANLISINKRSDYSIKTKDTIQTTSSNALYSFNMFITKHVKIKKLFLFYPSFGLEYGTLTTSVYKNKAKEEDGTISICMINSFLGLKISKIIHSTNSIGFSIRYHLFSPINTILVDNIGNQYLTTSLTYSL